MAPIVDGLRVKWDEEVNFVFLDILNRRSDPLKKALDYFGVPQSILLDGEGNILELWIGEVKEEDLDVAIQNILP